MSSDKEWRTRGGGGLFWGLGLTNCFKSVNDTTTNKSPAESKVITCSEQKLQMPLSTSHGRTPNKPVSYPVPPATVKMWSPNIGLVSFRQYPSAIRDK